MSKAQTDVVAALRIELDDTKAALAKAREDLSHALHSLDETKQCCDERRTQAKRAEKAEAACAALRESLEEANLVACYDECDHYGDTIVHNKECRAVADLLASPNPGEGWVSPEAHAEQRECARKVEATCGVMVAKRDEARAQAVDLAKQLEAERHLHDILGSTLRIRSLEAERDALTKQLEEARTVEEVKLRGRSALLRACEDERDSLRERLGDAERVIEATSLNLCVVADSHHEDARSACRAEIEKALAEFDVKWGRR